VISRIYFSKIKIPIIFPLQEQEKSNDFFRAAFLEASNKEIFILTFPKFWD